MPKSNYVLPKKPLISTPYTGATDPVSDDEYYKDWQKKSASAASYSWPKPSTLAPPPPPKPATGKARVTTLKTKEGHKLYLRSTPGYLDQYQFMVTIKNDLKDIEELAPDTIVVLLTDEDLWTKYLQYGDIDIIEEYEKMGCEVLRFPIEDYGVPKDMNSFNANIVQIIKRLQKGDVMIHCAAGLGRTGLVVAGLLIRLGKPAWEAIKYVRRARPGTVETKEQEEFLVRYAKLLTMSRA